MSFSGFFFTYHQTRALQNKFIQGKAEGEKKTGKKKFKGLKLDNTFVSYFPFALNLKVRFKEIAGLF